MPLDPLALSYLAQRAAAGDRPFDTLTVEAARELAVHLSALLGPGEPVAQVADRTIPGPGGPIPLRIYTPQGAGPLPLFVYFHGGGWVVGNLETVDALCRSVTNAARCIVVSVNYRHAPEHKFPAAVEDAYAATCWISRNAAAIGGRADRLAVGGTSAGGNLAAVVALRARDDGAPPIVLQVLSVPVTDYGFYTASYRTNGEGYVLTRTLMQWFWNHYLPTHADGATPHASPLRAKELRGLPPAFVMTAEYDPLHDEGAAYARRLREAGVPVDYRCYAGMVHVFLGPQATRDIAQRLRTAFTQRVSD